MSKTVPTPGADQRRRRVHTAPSPLESVRQHGFFRAAGVVSRASVEEIRDAIGVFGLARDHGFFASPAHAPGPMARDFDRFVRARLAERLREVIPGHRPFMVAVTSKGAGSDQEIKFHHDWTYTDERHARAVFLWSPMVPVTPRNAALMVVPGSHRWSTNIRPSRRLEVTEQFQSDYRQHAVTFRLDAGDAVVFDPATLHGSGPNRLDEPRPAITIGLIPDDADLVHFHLHDDGALSGAAVDDDFFTCQAYGQPPEGYPTVTPWTGATTEADVDPRSHRPSRHRRWLRPWGRR